MKKIDIVVPCYNEEGNIHHLVAELTKHIRNLDYHFVITFVDDGSTDNTYNEICELSRQVQDIKIIRFSRNFGKESAIAAAIEFCDADAAIIIDADLQHPPALIPLLIAEWEKGAEIVDAVKKEREKRNFFGNLMSISFNRIMTFLTDMDFSDASDYKLLDKKAIQAVKSLNEKNRFFRGFTNWIGYNHSKIEFRVENRRSGKTKWNWFQLIQLSLDAITSYSSKPLHIVTVLGLGTFAFSLFLGLQTLYNKLFGYAVTGFTTVILIVLMFSSVIMISIGLLGLYLSKIFKEVKNRPVFIVRQYKEPQTSLEETPE